MKPLSEFLPLLSAKPQARIVITTHHKPDADALGSSLGLLHYLKTRGFESVTVVSPTDYGRFLQWMPGEPDVVNYETHTAEAEALAKQADFIFCLDFNALKRINQFGDVVGKSSAQKILIDHHLEPEGFEDYRLWDTKASSTAELVYRFILMDGGRGFMNRDSAVCLYAGILTDTGNFRHNTTSPETHRIVADLLETGIQSAEVYSHIYDTYSLNRTRFIGYVLAHKLEVLPELNTAMMVISHEELKQYDIITGDTEGLVNYGLGIEGIRLAILVVDRKVRVKMSFRSKGAFPSNEFARLYFNGGGHFSAAGGESDQPLETVVAQIKEHLLSYRSLLTE